MAFWGRSRYLRRTRPQAAKPQGQHHCASLPKPTAQRSCPCSLPPLRCPSWYEMRPQTSCCPIILPPRHLNPHSISAWEVNNQISLHVMIVGKVFSVFSSTMEQASLWVVSMSASNKLTQWQVFSVQDVLVSHFIEPTYVNSIVIGRLPCSLSCLIGCLASHVTYGCGLITTNAKSSPGACIVTWNLSVIQLVRFKVV